MRESSWSVGIDVGGTKMLAIAVPLVGSTGTPAGGLGRLPVADLPTLKVATPERAGDIAAAAADLVAALGAHSVVGQITSVGFGLPGFIDRLGVARQAPNLPAIVGCDLGADLARRVGVSVTVDNDANCAAWAASCLDAPDADSVVAIALGTGIGGGIVIGGELVRGAHGFAGEPGHMIVDPDGPVCPCGQRGCWEVWASGTGLGRLAAAAIEAGDAPGLAARRSPVDGPVVMALAAQGDAEAVEIRRRFAGWVALGLVNLVNLLDPEVVILSGGIVAEGDDLLTAVRAALDGFSTVGPSRRLDLRISQVGPAAGALGAALLAGGSAAVGERTMGPGGAKGSR